MPGTFKYPSELYVMTRSRYLYILDLCNQPENSNISPFCLFTLLRIYESSDEVLHIYIHMLTSQQIQISVRFAYYA